MNLKQIEERLDDTFGNQRTTPYDLFITKKIREKIKQFISTSITQLLEELKMEKESDDNDIKRGDGELTNYIRGSWMGFNTCADEINSKIDKILNK